MLLPCDIPATDTTTSGAPLSGARPLQHLLERWVEEGWLRPLDAAFAHFLVREVPQASPLLLLGAALASHQLGRGHVCLDLEAVLRDPAYALSLPPEGRGRSRDSGEAQRTPATLPAVVLAGLTAEAWIADLLRQPLLVGQGSGDTPLVLQGARLYLRRYWQYERNVRAAIDRRLQRGDALLAALPHDTLRDALQRLFPNPSSQKHDTSEAPDWQRLACAMAAGSAFGVITGGPGTGKTTTVVRVLALLQMLALDPVSGRSGKPWRIRLAAPTGKAAARLNESIAKAVHALPLDGLAHADAIRDAIPLHVTTLHRLLGSRPDSRHFRHHAGNPLALDLLVIDESSMVDLEMMDAVFGALPPQARLILLGDKDQLASVEAGAVLGELCRRADAGHYTPDTVERWQVLTGQRIPRSLVDPHGTAADQGVVMLRHSHRFSAASGIGQLAQAVNRGDAAAVKAIWRAGYADLAWVPAAVDSAQRPGDASVGGAAEAVWRSLILDGGATQSDWIDQVADRPARVGYRHYLSVLRGQQPGLDAPQAAFDAWARSVLHAHAQCQWLCALRSGPWGVEGLNRRVASCLHQAGLIDATEGWYLGRPVLVTRNDYATGLMNGDIGITLVQPAPDGQGWRLRVAFAAADGGDAVRWVLPSRLNAVETVYALTVHKSQGSEFTHAALVLPDKPSPVLTRELVYTGITRARTYFTLVAPNGTAVLARALQQRVLRASGLSQP